MNILFGKEGIVSYLSALSGFFAEKSVPPENAGWKLFGLTHILWIVLPIAGIVALYYTFKKHMRAGEITLYVFAAIMLCLRFTKYVVIRPNYWGYDWIKIIPYELCTISSFVMPFLVFFKSKKLSTYLFPPAIMGGAVTLLYADWVFNGQGINFNKLESLTVHILLIAIPFISVAVGRIEFDIKKIYRPIIATAALVVYAAMANAWFEPGSNHMYLNENPLDFNLFGNAHHMFMFALIFFIGLVGIYSPSLIALIRSRKKNKSQIKT